ncbi:MAG TPA: hypothetical protein VFH06_04705 [Candidatus Saccharimonadales bacterium]|nr:hypothetical protein [Candidatus Saccharimonadales bacterium]
MTAQREASFFDTQTFISSDEYDPKLSATEFGQYLIERDLVRENQKVELARQALMQGRLSQTEYASTVAKLGAVEQMAIQNGADPDRFDAPSIERGHHF